MEPRWHQNWGRSGPTDFFTKRTQKFVKICFFLEIGPYPKIFNVKFFRGEYLRNRYALTIQNMYIYRGLTDIFVRVIPARSREMAAKSDVPAKVRSRNKHNSAQTKHLWAKSSWEDFLNCISKILSGGFRSKMFRLAVIMLVTAPLGVFFFFETRVNFGWLYVGLKDPLPPLAIHILKALDVPFHMVPPNICHTYWKNWVNRDSVSLENSDFEGLKPRLHSKISDFQRLSVFSNFYAWNHIVCHRYT